MSLVELFQLFLAEYARRVLRAAPAGTAAMLGLQSQPSPTRFIAELDVTEAMPIPEVGEASTGYSARGISQVQSLARALSAADATKNLGYLYSLVYPSNVVRRDEAMQDAKAKIDEADDVG